MAFLSGNKSMDTKYHQSSKNLLFGKKSMASGVMKFYAHTNRFCVVQENIKPEVLKVQTELARSVH